MPQSPARKARTRAEIVEHAARLFRLRGYAGTNIDDIMLAAGLTRGAFYAHFTSKDDLFAEMQNAVWNERPYVVVVSRETPSHPEGTDDQIVTHDEPLRNTWNWWRAR